MEANERRARELIAAHLRGDAGKIAVLSPLAGGSTNATFFFQNALGERYQVRVGNPLMDRNNEKRLLAAFGGGGFAFYDERTGDAIRTWVQGRVPTRGECRSDAFLAAFAKQLKRLQEAPVDEGVSRRDFFAFEGISDFTGLSGQLQAYRGLVAKYASAPLVLAHNDLRPENLVWDGRNVSFIDFEWGSRNAKWWDLGNFLREIEYPLDGLEGMLAKHFPGFDANIMREFLFACTFYAYQWTFFPPPEANLGAYRANCRRLMGEYYADLVRENGPQKRR